MKSLLLNRYGVPEEYEDPLEGEVRRAVAMALLQGARSVEVNAVDGGAFIITWEKRHVGDNSGGKNVTVRSSYRCDKNFAVGLAVQVMELVPEYALHPLVALPVACQITLPMAVFPPWLTKMYAHDATQFDSHVVVVAHEPSVLRPGGVGVEWDRGLELYLHAGTTSFQSPMQKTRFSVEWKTLWSVLEDESAVVCA